MCCPLYAADRNTSRPSPVPPRSRSFSAVVEASGSAWAVSRQAWEAAAAEDPASAFVLQSIILRSASLSAAHAWEALDRAARA